MKRSTGYWSTALAAAALIALPASGLAQPPASPQPQPTTQTPTSQSTTAPSQTPDTATSPADHVRAAKQALSEIPQSSIPARDRTQFAQLRTHLNKLEREVATDATAKATAKSNWATDVSAIDGILAKLIGPEQTSGGANAATGTVGTTGSEVPSAAAGRSPTAASSLDENAKDKLRDVRRHLTELASSMSGTSSPSRSDATGAAASPSSPDTMGTPPSSAQAATPAQPPSTSSTPSTPSTPNTPATSSTPSTSSPPSGQADTTAAKQHLSEARDALSQLTTLPEASKLQGQARTQVSQLISNFNELITTQSNWRQAYDKVDANVNTLLGPDTNSAPPAAPSAAGTAGTTGKTPASNIQLDPAIREKLVEFRTHLKAFEQAAGGSEVTAATSTSSASGAMPPTAATSSTTNPSNPAAASPTAASASSPSGMMGTTAAEKSGHAEADQELNAIQAILDKAQNGSLSQGDTEQLKAHVARLRQLLAQSGGR